MRSSYGIIKGNFKKTEDLLLEKQVLIKKITRLAISLLVLITAVSFLAACVHIYFTEGETPFSRESVGEHLIFVLPQAVLTVAAIIFGLVYEQLNPSEESKLKGARCEYVSLERMRAAAVKKNEAFLRDAEVIKERYFRIILRSAFAFVAITASVVLTVLLSLSDRYTLEAINASVARSAVTAFITLGVIAVFGYSVSILCRISAEKEAARLKNLFTEKVEFIEGKENKIIELISKKCSICKEFFTKHQKTALYLARGIILATAVVFVIIGIINGGMDDVLGKAVKICTECIGLG